MSALTEALNRILHWLQQYSPNAISGFAPGLPLVEIETKLSQLPFRVSQEVYELYQWRNGNPYDGVFVYHRLLGLDSALECAAAINESYWLEIREQDGDPQYLFPVLDFDGEYFAVPGGDASSSHTPVFHIGCDDGSLSFAFTSLTNMMLAIAECYETGIYTHINGDLEVADVVRFGEVRRKYNLDTVAALYADGW
ncbi:SMI1/KNR4 family protein [Trichocoleus sp. FACHB-262]|uniref:SMI1/KNR4 family protein n=1 Tax=Trichocoleus sp. FACHB-262 TaxID=2692869 RepID=UPI001686D847|nr:SMI1/KNR4 family protein [Trichocoleus sp. FACHB-262]MBD2120156.1 SMI1/KNR4 family protein [Trichocoleus sp. FACHB-262]